MKANQIKKIRAELSNAIPFTRAVELRAKLESHNSDNYKPQHKPAQVLSFIEEFGNGLQLRKVHPQDNHTPFVWQLFTPKSAWVVGDSPAECFDRAIKVKQDWTQLSTTDVNTLIMTHEAVKDAKDIISKNVQPTKVAEAA